MQHQGKTLSRRLFLAGLGGLAASAAGIAAVPWWMPSWSTKKFGRDGKPLQYAPHRTDSPYGDSSGYTALIDLVDPWQPNATLKEISRSWLRVGYRNIERVDQVLAAKQELDQSKVMLVFLKTLFCNYEAEPLQAYQLLEGLRSALQDSPPLLEEWLYTVIYYQGVTAMRRGETDNCVKCRGTCSCILPFAPSAVHTNQDGSRLAIKHFTEQLGQFPDDFESRWLLNVAHMTLGEYPDKVDPTKLISLDHYDKNEFDVGRFREVGAAAGVDRFNMSGGAIMDDFDNDGLLDLFVTTRDPTESAAYYHNKGDGAFEDRTGPAGLGDQLGGFNCVQADYDNDGNLDVFIARGAWLPWPIRPSLLRNNGDGTFTDVTERAGLLDPVNSPSATWADYDNDGFLDLFICCERQPNRLYHNEGNGTFKEVAAQAGFRYDGRCAKGAAWIDYDNDGWPDLFVCNSGGAPSQLFHNNRNGSFTDVTEAMGIRGPYLGFSCWAWDFDNDGWLDIFATSYERTLEDSKDCRADRTGRRIRTNSTAI
jgi:FG-GAP-like repeat